MKFILSHFTSSGLILFIVACGSVVAGLSAARSPAFWCDVRGGSLAVAPDDVDLDDQTDVVEWDFTAGQPSKERKSSLAEYTGH